MDPTKKIISATKAIPKTKVFILYTIISLLFGLAMFISLSYTATKRDGKNEKVINLTDTTIQQKVRLSKFTKKVFIYFASIVNNPDNLEKQDPVIAYQVFKGKNIICEGAVHLKKLKFHGWTHFDINLKHFHDDGYYDIVIFGEKLSPDNTAHFLLSQMQQDNFISECIINKSKNEGFICLSYNYYELKNFIKFFFFSMLFFLATHLLITTLKKAWRAPLGLVFLLCMRYFIDFFQFRQLSLADNKMASTLWLFNFQDFGLSRRIFPGTIIRLFNNTITLQEIRVFSFILQLITLGALCFYILSLNKNLSTEHTTSYINIITLLFISSPFSLSFYPRPIVFMLYDPALLLALILCCICLYHDKATFLVPFFSLCAIWTHEVFAILIFPYLFVIMLYKIVFLKQKKTTFIVTLLSTLISFLYLLFFSHIPFSSYQELEHVLKTHTENNVLDAFFITFYFFTSVKDQLLNDYHVTCTAFIFIRCLIGLTLLTPIWVIIHSGIKDMFIKEQHQHSLLKKTTLILIYLCPCCIFIAGIKACDYGRWFTLSGFSMMLTILTLCGIDKNGIGNSFQNVIEKLSNRYGNIWYIVVAVYLLLLGIGNTADCTGISNLILSIIKKGVA